MSNNINDKLFDRANEMVEFWTGTQYADRILFALKLNDLDEVERLVREAESQAYQELRNEALAEAQDEMTDERASVMYKEFGDVF